MHVLQVLPRLEVGGVERGVLDLAKGLLARGHRVSVVSAGGPLVEPLTRMGAVHHELPIADKSLATVWSTLPALTHLIRSTEVDVVHARSRVPAWIGLAAARRAQRPFVTTAHGFYKPHWASRIMVWGRVVIAPSESLGRYLLEQFQLPPHRLRIIPRGVNLTEFQFHPETERPADRPWRIGLFGRVSPIKGHEVALRAMAQLRAEGLPVTVCIAGDTPGSARRRHLETLSRTLKIEEAVEWCGIRRDIPAAIASVDVVAVPSIYPESFGRGVIEAQAVGRPVVASRLGGLAELIQDRRTGLLVPPNDPGALADALKRFIQDAALRNRCVEAARRRVEADFHHERMVEQTLRVYEECLERPRTLLWKLSALGDVILATPSLRAIRRQYPHGHIGLVVGRAAYEVVARCPYVDELLIYDPTRKDRGLRGQWRFLRRLRREGYDLSIDLQNSRQTHLLAWLAGIPVRVGYRRKCGRLLNRGVRLPRVVLAPIAHQQYLLRQAGFQPDGESLELWPSHQDEAAVDQLLSQESATPTRPLVGLHPGGSGRWKTKRWDLERWARLADELMKRNVQVVLTGSAEERELADALLPLMRARPLDVMGKTRIMELACLIKRCQAFVAHDSSPLHLAAAMGTPTVALFGPTDPARHLPPAFQGEIIKRDVFCSPCYSTSCRTMTHACMKRITVEDVLSAVLGLLADTEADVSAAATR